MENRHTEIWDRTASSDLWVRTLAQIPSAFGRLVYLSSLRDVVSDQYHHHGLATMFGETEADRALRESHEKTFAEWLTYTIEQQKADLDLFLSTLDQPRRVILQTWQRLAPYRNLIPSSASDEERGVYLVDLEALMELLRNEFGAGPAASRRR